MPSSSLSGGNDLSFSNSQLESELAGGAIYTVDELCLGIREIVEEFEPVSVQGEVQNVFTSARGHKYFELAGEKALIKVKMWASTARDHTFNRGDNVVVEGSLDFYPPKGEISITARKLTLAGEGAILAKIEAVRRRLESEGLFSEERKQELPFLPRAIGVICGTDAAVKRDIEAARSARFPEYPIVWRESLVSGASAAGQLIEALDELDRDPRVDVIIIARGGGSFDDLLPFNDEQFCRAIAAASTPVVSAIGHEADAPLSDFVADLRCSTPTRAGIEVIPSRSELSEQADSALDELERVLASRIELASGKVRSLGVQVSAFRPRRVVESLIQRLEHANPVKAMRERHNTSSATCDALQRQLEALDPASILGRGYAVVRTTLGAVVTEPQEAPAGTGLEISLSRGTLAAVSEGSRPQT